MVTRARTQFLRPPDLNDVLVHVFSLVPQRVLDAPGSLAISSPTFGPLVVTYGREHDHDRSVGRVEASG